MSTAKPLIGITGDFRPERYNGAALSWFNTGYYDSVLNAGGLPMLLPPLEDEDAIQEMMDQVSGVVLSCWKSRRIAFGLWATSQTAVESNVARHGAL